MLKNMYENGEVRNDFKHYCMFENRFKKEAFQHTYCAHVEAYRRASTNVSNVTELEYIEEPQIYFFRFSMP